jgi:uncharacterized protein YqgC (DUF456 family)
MEWIFGLLGLALVVAGVAGTILPVLPGTPLILAGAVIHKLAFPGVLNWGVVGILAVLMAIALVLKNLGSVLGAKWGGAGTWGLVGAGIGVLVGLFFGLPGLILGPVVGALLAEVLFAKKSWRQAAQAGLGAGLGFLGGSLAELAIALLMALLVVLDMVF